MKKILFGILAAALLTGTVVFASDYASCKEDSCPACCEMCCDDKTSCEISK